MNFKFPVTKIMRAPSCYGYAREPVLGRMPDGSMLCLALSGGRLEPDNANVVLAARSQDEGKTWSEPSALFSHGARGVWATELFTEGDVPCIFVHTYDAACRYRELSTYRSWSDDNGETWTEPVSLPSGIRGVSVRKGIVLQSGTWLFPVYWQESVKYWDWTRQAPERTIGPDWPKHCGVLLSEDGGLTFSIHGDLQAEFPLWEPTVVELKPDQLMMLIRAEGSGVLYEATSTDGGHSWSAAQPTEIPNPGTKISVLRVQNRLLLLHNPAAIVFGSHDDRRPLSLWASTDGSDWSRRIHLCDPDLAMFYPHPLADDASETLYVACENAAVHYLVRVPYAAFL